jgi:hypothetical protein
MKITKRHWGWLKESEQWRIGYAFKTLRFFPRWIFEYISDNGYSQDLEQVIQTAVFLTCSMDANAASRVIQKEIRTFLTSIMIRKRGGQWKAVEFLRSDTVLESLQQKTLLNSNLIDTTKLDMKFWGLEEQPIEKEPRIRRPTTMTKEEKKLYNKEHGKNFRDNNRDYWRAYQRAHSKGIHITKKEWERTLLDKCN